MQKNSNYTVKYHQVGNSGYATQDRGDKWWSHRKKRLKMAKVSRKKNR